MEASSPLPEELEALSSTVVDAAFNVHRNLGPGLLESVYQACLCVELNRRRVAYESEVVIPVVYEGVDTGTGLRLDLLVEKSLIVEIKAIEQVIPLHRSQLLTYLRLADLRLGLLINFNVAMFKDGVKRVIR